MKFAGILMASLCGLCTTTCAGPAAIDALRGQADYMAPFYLMIAAIIGGAPALCGVALYLGGRWVERGLKAERRSSDQPPRT